MSFRLLNISSMYPGYLKLFQEKFPEIKKMSYNDHIDLLLSDTTEVAGSYNRNFRKSGIDANCIIANDISLQKKWRSEYGLRSWAKEDILFKQVKIFKPEILWIENLDYLSINWFAKVKKEIRSIRLIIACHCAPYNQTILAKLKCADFVITCTPGLKQTFENIGIRSYLVYHGFDNDLLNRLDNKNHLSEKKFVFSGSLFSGGDLHNERIRMIDRILKEKLNLELYVNLDKTYKIKIKQSIYFLSAILKKLSLEKLTDKVPLFEYARSPVKNYSKTLIQSNHQPVFGIDMYNLFNMSDIVLNMHIGVAGDFAGNMRLFEVTGIGSCMLTDNKKNLGELFDIGNEIVAYNSVDDCIEKVKWLMEHEAERKKIAACGQQKTLRSHTVEERCKLIIEIISGELKSQCKPG
jgi:spore maturation protein CgeB